MNARSKIVCASVGGAVVLAVTLRAVSFPGVFFQGSVGAISGAVALGLDPNDLPDPNDPNDVTGIAGLVAAYDAQDPNQDPNDPNTFTLISGVVVFALIDGEIVGSGASGPEDMGGMYYIYRLTPGTYDLKINPPGYATTLRSDVVVAFGQMTREDICDLVPEGRISGTVTDSGGTPIDGSGGAVTVSVDCGPGISFVAVPDPNGVYLLKNLPEGTFTVSALSLDYSFPDCTDVVVTQGNTSTGIDFQADPAGKIVGRLFDVDGVTPIPDALISADDGGEERRTIVAVTEPNGAYKLRNIPPGDSWTVVACDGQTGEELARASDVAVSDGQTASLNLIAPGGAISGTVSGDIAGAIIRAVSVVGTSVFQRTTVTDAAGEYILPRLRPGTYIVGVKASGYGGRKIAGVQVVAGQETTGQDFSLTVEGIVTGRVTDENAAPIRDAMVVAEPGGTQDPNCAGFTTETDANGDYSLGHLATGTYQVIVIADGYVGGATTGVGVTAGQTTAEIDFVLRSSGGGRITGTVTAQGGGPITHALVACQGPGLTHSYTQTDDAGDYELSLLKPGAYTVFCAVAEGFANGELSDVVVTEGATTSGQDFILAPE